MGLGVVFDMHHHNLLRLLGRHSSTALAPQSRISTAHQRRAAVADVPVRVLGAGADGRTGRALSAAHALQPVVSDVVQQPSTTDATSVVKKAEKGWCCSQVSRHFQKVWDSRILYTIG